MQINHFGTSSHIWIRRSRFACAVHLGLSLLGLFFCLPVRADYQTSAEAQSAAQEAQDQISSSQKCLVDVVKDNDKNNADGSKLVGEAQKLYQEKAQTIQELEAGMYCSLCWRTASEIERQDHTTFAQHLQDVKGQAMPAPASKIKEKADEYDQKIKDIQSEIQDHKKTYQNLVKQYNQCWAERSQASSVYITASTEATRLKAAEKAAVAAKKSQAALAALLAKLPPLPPIVGLNAEQERLIAAGFLDKEGNIPYMYLDSKGNPTVGIGHLLASVEDAKKVFSDASPADVQKDWDALQTKKQSILDAFNVLPDDQKVNAHGDRINPFQAHPATEYNSLTALELTPVGTGEVLSKDMAASRDAVGRAFPHFVDYPFSAQQAMVDLQFNTGSLTNKNSWKNFYTAINTNPLDWNKVAAESHRKDIPENRNEAIADLFRQAGRPSSPVPGQAPAANPQPFPTPQPGPTPSPLPPASPVPSSPPGLGNSFDKDAEPLRVLDKIAQKREEAALKAAAKRGLP